jgi:filamentous hemagglutinin family protein
MSVVSGTATAAQNGPQLTITTSQNAYLNWQTFNIAAGETTIFQQPSAQSVVWNHVNDPNPSQIFGSLQANGIVVLMNSAGFYFGPNSYVKTGGLIVSTANCPPAQASGGMWQFNGPPPAASIVNYGKIDVAPGGPAYLIAENVVNYGSINAPGGDVRLAAGQQVVLSERPDGRGLSMVVNLPDGSVDNEGHITADAGTIAMNARIVNQNGLVQANSARDVNGVIELVASDQLNLGANSQITADGDASPGGSAGGSVTLQSGDTFSDSVGSRIDVTGGSQGGNGGSVEISAPSMTAINSQINGQAQSGWLGGSLSLDPDYIVLNQSGSGTLNVSGSSGTVLAGSNPGSTLYLNVGNSYDGYLDSAFIGLSQILLEAKYDITLADGTAWNLSASAGQSSGQLTLEAGRNIVLDAGASLTDANSWNIALYAGVSSFSTSSPTVQPGSGNIWLNGGVLNDLGQQIPGSFIQTAAGNLSLTAGQDILVNADKTDHSGYVITTGGGSIYAHALAGNIDTGDYAQGYHFVSNAGSVSTAYNLNDGLGGISTAAGGDVTLIAGGDVTSVLPGYKTYYYDGTAEPLDNVNGNDYLTAGAGAYGSQPGNVTIVAGGSVAGNYVVANGVGGIYAGAKMDANGNPVVATDAGNNPITEKDANGNPVKDVNGNPVYVYALNPNSTGSAGKDTGYNGLALDLISGGWNVAAAQNILLQEVRNPNGVFNSSGAYSHYFDYAANAFVNLSAGQRVQLGADLQQLPRLSHATGNVNNVPVIYPSIVNITAGVSGVELGTPNSPSSLILFPSAQGGLTIDTTGPLFNDLNGVSGAPQLFNLIVSDAGHKQYTTTANFGASDHAASPIHAGASTPIDLNIGGDMNYINLVFPEASQINVGGGMNNCGFQGMNVSAAAAFQEQVFEADGSTRTVTVDPSVTSINVAGEIFSRGNFTTVDLSGILGGEGLDLSDLAIAIPPPGDPSATTLATSFYYDPTTETLTYEDIPQMTLANVLNLLNDLTVQEFINGVPQWLDPPFDTLPKPDTEHPVSVLGDPTQPGTVAYALLTQYKALSAYPYALPYNAGTYGYTIGGGGQFNVTAQTVDLGASTGIQSEGAALYVTRGNYPLAGLFGNGGVFERGADINVTTTGNHSAGTNPRTGDVAGDLNMFSSSIGSFGGGNVSIQAGGDVNAGSSVLSANVSALRGIYSTSGGDVTVVAADDVNVNGSRIATYNGGNITVESLNGDVNVGNGASTPVPVTGYYEDPVTHAIYSDSTQLPFSGIVALTFPDDPSYPAPAALGNILVEAPHGNITANAAGILQIPLNNLDYPDATTTVLAGYKLNGGGEPEITLDSQNIVTFGPTVQLDNGGQPISVTQVLDANGAPVFDAAGRQLYVENLGTKGGLLITYNLAGGQVSIDPELDPAGNPLHVANVAGATDAQGNPVFVFGRNINVNGSGIIAGNANLDASGDINGLIFARNNININAQQNVNVTAFGIGNVSVNSSGGTISGTLIGVNGVNASGSSVVASLISANVSGVTSGQSGLGQGVAANAASQGLANSQSTQANAAADQGDEEKKKKKGKEIALTQKVSRVTVILPPKKVSETTTSTPGT